MLAVENYVGTGEPPADVSQGCIIENPGQIISQNQVYKPRYIQPKVYRAGGMQRRLKC